MSFSYLISNLHKILINKDIKPLSLCTRYANINNSRKHFQVYCSTVYSRSGVNQIWMLKNSKELEEILYHKNKQNEYHLNVRLPDTLYNHNVKSACFNNIDNCFFNKKNSLFSYLVICHLQAKIVKKRFNLRTQILLKEYKYQKMLAFLIDIIWVALLEFPWIPITFHFSRAISIFIWSRNFFEELYMTKKSLSVTFISTCRYIDDVLYIYL